MLQEGESGTATTGTSGAPAPRRPLVGMALLVLTGTLLGLRVPLPIVPLLVMGFLCAVLVWRLPRGLASLPLALLLVVAASLRADLSARDPSPAALHRVMGGREEGVTVVGTVVEDPVPRISYAGEAQWEFAYRVEAIDRIGTWQRARGRVRCTVRGADVEAIPAYGDRWVMQGSLRPPYPGGRPRSGAGEGRLNSRGGDLLARNQASALMRWCIAGRRASAAALGRGLEAYPTHHALLKALLLGYREELPPDLRTAFSATGTLHMFAISGLHVGILSGLLMGVLNTVGFPRHRWILLLAPALVAYTMATGLKPSAVRACVMALSYWLSALVGRRPDGLSALALAAVVMVVYAPLQLVTPGFILSFTVVAGLLLLTPPLHRIFRSWAAPDPWAPTRRKGLAHHARAALAVVLGLFAFSLVAWSASLPLTATFFHIFSPIAVFGNLLVVPAAYVVVLTGCLSIVTSPLSGFVAEVFNHANRVLIDVLLGFIDLMAAVPGGHRFVRAPHPVWVVVWYLLLAGWALAPPTRRNRLRLGACAAVASAVWVGLCAVPRPLEINVLDAGGGVVIHVDAGRREHLLVNAGSVYESGRVARHLRSRGVNRVRALILSSHHARDAGGLAALTNSVPLDEVWVPPVAAGEGVHLPDGLPAKTLVRGDRGFLADGSSWEVLAPPSRFAYADPARAAPIIKFGRDGLAAVYVGGWDLLKGREFARAPIESGAPVLIWGERRVPHPDELDFERIGPECVLLSVKPYQTLADDYAPVLRRLAAHAEVLRTDETRGIVLRSRRGPPGPNRRGYEVLRLD